MASEVDISNNYKKIKIFFIIKKKDEERSTNTHNLENYEFTNKCLASLEKTKHDKFDDFETNSFTGDIDAPNFDILQNPAIS